MPNSSEMVQKFKRSIGPATDTMSEEEILQAMKVIDRLADIVFEHFLKHHTDPQWCRKVGERVEKAVLEK